MKFLKWTLLVSGILLIVCGVTMFFTPLANLVFLSWFICLAILAFGVSQILTYFGDTNKKSSGWMLVSGIVSVLVGGWLLFSPFGTTSMAVVLPMTFSVWILVSGIIQIIGAINTKKYKTKSWLFPLIFGIAATVLGLVLLFQQFLAASILSILIAGLFVLRGVEAIGTFFTLNKLDKAINAKKENP